MVTNPCFQTLLVSKFELLGRKASLSGIWCFALRAFDCPLDQSVVCCVSAWPAMLVLTVLVSSYLGQLCKNLEAAGAEVIVFFESLSHDQIARWKVSVAWWHWVCAGR